MAWELGALVVVAVSELARVAPSLIREAGEAAKPLLRQLAKDKNTWYAIKAASHDPAIKQKLEDIDEGIKKVDEGIKKAADGMKETTKKTYDYVNYKDETGGWTKK